MNDQDEHGSQECHDDALAAEFVLGSLSGTERLRAENRLAADAAFAERVNGWRRRLHPLQEPIVPMAPSASVWEGIASRIAKAPR